MLRAMGRFALCGAVLTMLLAGRAAANPVDDVAQDVARAQALVDRARELARTANEVRDFLYYLSDPRGFEYDLYATQSELLSDPIIGPLARNLASLYSGRVWTATLQGQAMADTGTPASAAIGATLSWDMPLCRLFEAQAAGQVFYEDEGPSAAMTWGVGGCLPLPFDTFELGYRGRRAVRTSLLSVPIIAGDRQRGDTIYSNLRFYRYLSARHQIDVMPLSVNFDFASVGNGTSSQAYLVFGPAHWARRGKGYRGRDQSYDFFRIVLNQLGVDDGIADPLVASFSPLAIDGVSIGDHVQLGLDVGWEQAEVYDAYVMAVSRQALHLDASVIGGVDGATVELHVRNAMQPTLYNQLLDEDRVTGRVDLERRAAWLRVDGFASHARLIGSQRYSDRVWTYGAGADVTVALTKHVFGYARGETARGLVVETAAPTPDTALDLRGTLGVTTRFDRTW